MTNATQRIAAYLPWAKEWEGVVNWLYLDTRGFVTVGCGHLLVNPAAACALPFKQQDGTPASNAQITSAYNRVIMMEPGHSPNFYHPNLATVTLNNSDVDALLEHFDIADADEALVKRVPGYEGFPATVQLALTDMVFNMGVDKLLHGFPTLMAAVQARKWSLAAGNCHRQGPGPERNAWCAKMFAEAAQ